VLDANEDIVRRYFELGGYFVRTNLPYQFRTDKGSGWSDIDLCVIHPRTGDAAAAEVKGWHTERITPSYLRDWPRLFYFTDPRQRLRSQSFSAVRTSVACSWSDASAIAAGTK
jgi:hypothetical protein